MDFRDKLYPALQRWLALGLLVQLAGLCLVTDGSRYTTLVNLLLFLPALLAALILWRRINPWPSLPSLALGALLLWVLAVAVLNPGSVGDLKRWLRVTLYAWLYLLAITLVMQDERLWRWLLGAVVLVAAICAWGSLIQTYYVDQQGMGYREFRIFAWGWRGLADFNNTIMASLYYSVVLLTVLFLLLHSNSRIARGLYLLAVCGLLAYLYFTFSRGVWGAALMAGVVLLWFVPNRRVRLMLSGAAVPVFLVMLWLVSGLAGGAADGLGLSFRDLIWHSWLTRLGDFWLWGRGAGAEFNICVDAAGRCFNQAHSLYLQFFYEYGLPGLLLLLVLLLSLLVHAWRCRRQPMGQLGLALLVFVLVAAVANLYEIFLRPGVFWLVFWLPVGILLGLTPDSRRAAAVQ